MGHIHQWPWIAMTHMQSPDEEIPALVLAINWENIQDATLSFSFFVVFPLVSVISPITGRKHDPVWPFFAYGQVLWALNLLLWLVGGRFRARGTGECLLRQCVCGVFPTVPGHGPHLGHLKKPSSESVHPSLPKKLFSFTSRQLKILCPSLSCK